MSIIHMKSAASITQRDHRFITFFKILPIVFSVKSYPKSAFPSNAQHLKNKAKLMRSMRDRTIANV